jgi:hypothetical protein
MAEWIENKGNDCPVPAGTRVELKFSSGNVHATQAPERFLWVRLPPCYEVAHSITHYRVIE